MKHDFIRNRRDTKDHFDPLTIQIEKKTPRKRNVLVQAAINVAVYAVVFLLFYRNNLSNIIYFLGFMVASTVGQIVIERYLSNKDGAEYRVYLDKIEQQVDQFLEDYKNYCLSTLIPARQIPSVISQTSPMLYYRLPFHQDFLTLNLGEGLAEYPINISYPHVSYNEKDPMLKSFKKGMEQKLSGRNSDILPYGFSLKKNKSIAFANKNLSEAEFMSIINAAALDVATFQSPEEVRMCFCFNSDVGLDCACYLPHVWFGNRRLVFCGTESVGEFSELLNEAIADKKKHLVVVLDFDFMVQPDLLDLYSKFNVEDLPENVSVIFFSVNGHAPSRVNSVVECTKNQKGLLGTINNKSLKLNSIANGEDFELARKLFNIQLIDNRSVISKGIPEKISFYELFNINNAKRLPQATLEENVIIQERFPVLVGVGLDNKGVWLDLTNDGDGNHCLLTGTNGSGKSKFIHSYILSACSKYHPDYFSFAIIDFKGGMMSGQVKDLPHCRGEFTNKSATKRDIIRIKNLLESEIHYRERILGKYSLSHYHELYKNGKVSIPLPRLLVVIDEVAVLLENDNTAVKYINHLATVGRELGIILMLSTQTKSGVIPSQAKTNINVTVDFYSEDNARKDGKKIKGRAIINSNIKSNCECQVALASVTDSNYAVIDFISISGKSRFLDGQGPKKQFELVRDELIERYKNAAYVGNVITENLDTRFAQSAIKLSNLQQLYYSGEDESNEFPVGVSDNIFEREYNFFTYTPSEYNLLVYGGPRSGKTTFVKTLLTSMLSLENGIKPSKLAVYIAAKNPQEYNNYNFPHVGSILPENQLFYFLLFLYRTIQSRKRQPDNTSYTPIVAIMDDCRVFSDERLTALFSEITAESVQYGISVIFTTSTRPSFNSHALDNFSSKIAFYMGDDYDYPGLNIHIDAVKSVEEVPGRCLVDMAGQYSKTLETQIALPYVTNEDEIRVLCERYNELWDGKPVPSRIPTMPEVVSMRISRADRRIPVGVCEDLTCSYWDPDIVNSYLVSYFLDKDAVDFARYMIKTFIAKDFDVIVVDNQRGNLKEFNSANVNYFSFNDRENLLDKLTEKVNNINESKDTVIIALDFARLFYMSQGNAEKRFANTLQELLKNREHRFFGVLIDFKDAINSFKVATSLSGFGASLIGANSGLLLGQVPADHLFGASSLSTYKEQYGALNSGYGVHVSPMSGETKKIKYATEVSRIE